MVQELLTVPAACPQCAQKLRVPGQNLKSVVRCPRCRSVLALADIVSRDTPILPAWTLSPVSFDPKAIALDDMATQKDLPVVFADGTLPIVSWPESSLPVVSSPDRSSRPTTDDVDPKASVGVTLADVLPRAVARQPLLAHRGIPRKDFGRRIVHALRSHASAPARFRNRAAIVRALTSAADRLATVDAFLRPRATSVLLGMAALSLAAMTADALGFAEGLGAAAGGVFIAFTATLAFARTATIREDDGSLTAGALFDAAKARRHALEADARGFFSSPGTQRKAFLGRFLFGWGLVALFALDTANLVEAALRVLIGSEAAHDVDVYVGASALVIMALGALLRRSAARGPRPLAREVTEDSLEPFFRARSAILAQEDAIAGAPRFPGRASEILAAVGSWRPARERTSQAYGKHLARHLRRHVGSVSVEPAEDLVDAYGKIRNAVIVGGSLLVVIRRRAHLDPERALRGVRRARSVWRKKPVLAVFVESPAGHASRSKDGEPVERQLGRALDTLTENDPRVVGVWLADG
jgi:hypothetical protein